MECWQAVKLKKLIQELKQQAIEKGNEKDKIEPFYGILEALRFGVRILCDLVPFVGFVRSKYRAVRGARTDLAMILVFDRNLARVLDRRTSALSGAGQGLASLIEERATAARGAGGRLDAGFRRVEADAGWSL